LKLNSSLKKDTISGRAAFLLIYECCVVWTRKQNKFFGIEILLWL